jgi:hypothetical protein
MKILTNALFLFAAFVNLAPVSGVLSADILEGLYGITLEDPNLVILMQHRAVLFGIVGVLLVACVFRPALRPIGLAVGLTSMLAFVVIAYIVGDFNTRLQNVVWIDLAASAALLGAGIADRCCCGRGKAAST